MGGADGEIHRLERRRYSTGAGGLLPLSDGEHRPVLLGAAIEALRINPEGVYVDCTFGRGGHSRAILQRLGLGGRLLALDRDPAAVVASRALNDPRLSVVHLNFSRLNAALDERRLQRVDGILLDLGVSSPQLDEARRGFSFRNDGPLDMRMDDSRGITAAQWLANASENDIGEVIKAYGEERFAQQVARAIVAARSREPLLTTRQLAQIVARAVRTREPGQDPATRTFQALRIFLNQELEELSLALPQCVQRLAQGGRLAVISFHSLEDRIVKHFLRDAARPPRLPRRLPVRAAEFAPPALRLIGKPLRASEAEVAANPRARSALLRVAEKLAE